MSKTALGALLLTLVLVLAAGAALGFGLPPVAVEGARPAEIVALLEARASFSLAWFGSVVTGLGVAAAAWGVYGLRNVPAPGTWRSAAPTSAQLALGVRSTYGPPPAGEDQ